MQTELQFFPNKMPVKYLLNLLKEVYAFIIDYLNVLIDFKKLFLKDLVPLETVNKIKEDAFDAELLRITLVFLFDVGNFGGEKKKKQKKPKEKLYRDLLKKK